MKNGKAVLIRTYSAGVHFGQLASHKDKEVVLKKAQRIWYWKGANTLHGISLRGCGVGSKISEPISEITLTEAIEILPMTDTALKTMARLEWVK